MPAHTDNDITDIQLLVAEAAALRCVHHALAHTLIVEPNTGAAGAIATIDRLAAQWHGRRAKQSERAAFHCAVERAKIALQSSIRSC